VANVGADRRGDEPRAALVAAGVDTTGFQQIPGAASGVAIIHLTPDGEPCMTATVPPERELSGDDFAAAPAGRYAAVVGRSTRSPVGRGGRPVARRTLAETSIELEMARQDPAASATVIRVAAARWPRWAPLFHTDPRPESCWRRRRCRGDEALRRPGEDLQGCSVLGSGAPSRDRVRAWVSGSISSRACSRSTSVQSRSASAAISTAWRTSSLANDAVVPCARRAPGPGRLG
jgi:hypothetical protein